MLSSIAYSQDLLPQDPYAQKVNENYTHELNVRVINHGVEQGLAWAREQIKATQIIYAQCDVQLKINLIDEVSSTLTTEQDQIYDFSGSQLFMSLRTQELLRKWQETRDQHAIDIHVVDHLNAQIRTSQTVINQMVNLGIAFNSNLFNWVIHGVAPERAGNTLFLAAGTVQLIAKEGRFLLLNNLRGYDRHLSLLAHEMGHILLEGQLPNERHDNTYFDHWCEQNAQDCDFKNLMSSGGNDDRVWKKANGKVKGFDPLPEMDQAQCQRLIQHPLVRAL